MNANTNPPLSKINLNTLAIQAEEMIHWLSSFGEDHGGGVTRLLYSSSWKEAQLALAKQMEEFGLSVYHDDVGNLLGD